MKLSKLLESEMSDDLSYILEIMGGADGGVGFVRLKAFLKENEGHPGLTKIVKDFANLIRVINGERKQR